MNNRFAKLFKVGENNQLLVIRTEGSDYSVIDECTCIKGTIVKNTIDFTGENHIKDSMEYLDGINLMIAKEQHASLVERIAEFLNPE